MSLNNALRTPSGFNSNNAALRDTSSPSLNATRESANNNTNANASDSFSRAAIASTTRGTSRRLSVNAQQHSRVDQYRSRATYFESRKRCPFKPNRDDSQLRSACNCTFHCGIARTQHHPVSEHIPRDRGLREKESFWTWQNILPKVAIAIGTITLGIALWNTAAAAPALLKANGVLAGMGKVGAAFISNLGQAFLYVVVTPFVAAYEEFGPLPSS